MKEQDYVDIEVYLQGEMPADEAAALEARAAADADFAAALAARRQLNEHLQAEAREKALRATLTQLGDKYFAGENVAGKATKTEEKPEAVVRQLKSKKGNRTYLGALIAAAAIALLVFFGGDFLFPQADAFERFAQHQPLSLTERGDGDNGITEIETAYNEGRYADAIAGLENYLTEKPADNRARLALGVSLLEESRTPEAIKVLSEVADGEGSVAPYANWYLALAAMRTDDTDEVRRRLDLIPATDTFLAERVAELREMIE